MKMNTARRQAATGEPLAAENKSDIAAMAMFAALRQASIDVTTERIARALGTRGRATVDVLAKSANEPVTTVRQTVDAMMAHGLVAREELQQRGCIYYIYWLDARGWRALAQALLAFAASLEPQRRSEDFAPRLVGGRG